MLEKIFRKIDIINDFMGRMMAYVVIFVVFVITYGVVLRYVFKSPSPLLFELTIYPLAAVYALGAGYALLYDAHVKVDVFLQKLSPKSKQILLIITFPIFVVFCMALIWGGYQWAWQSYLMNETTGSDWGLKLYPYKFSLPVGATLLLLQGIRILFRNMNVFYRSKNVMNNK